MLKANYNRNPYIRPFDSLLKDKKDLIGVEVGVYRGQHAREMLVNLDIKIMYLVDTWKNYSGYNEEKLENQLGEAYYDAKELLKEFDNGEKMVWVKDYSVKAAKRFEDNSLDFCYIDANHTYKFIKEDIRVWLPKIKIGGLIGGHDYTNAPDRYKYGVKTAVDEHCKKYGIKVWTKWCPRHANGDRTKDWGFIKNEANN